MSSKKDKRKDDAREAKLEQQGKKNFKAIYSSQYTLQKKHIHAI